jgi:hypothetical protein
MQITGGTVSYERRVKTGEFEWKQFTSILNFTSDKGEDPEAALHAASRIAVNHTHQMVGLLKAAPGEVKTTSAGGDAAKAAFADKAAGKTPAPAAPKKGAAKPPAAGKKAAAPTGQSISEGDGEPFDPLADDTPPAQTLPDDDITDLLGEAEPVTDAQLNQAAVAKATQTKNGGAIRQLGAKFGGGPAPKTLRDIPQEKRNAFLEELKKL